MEHFFVFVELFRNFFLWLKMNLIKSEHELKYYTRKKRECEQSLTSTNLGVIAPLENYLR